MIKDITEAILRINPNAKLGTDISAAKLTAGTIPNARYGTPTFAATNLTAIPAANLTGTLPAISGANLTGVGGGKLLQVKTKYLANSVAQTGSNISTIIESDTVTLSSSSNSLYCIASINYDLQGYSSTTDPAAQFYLYDEADNPIANVNIERQMTNNADGRESVCVLQAFYSPPDTSEKVRVRYKCDNGQIRARGSNNYHNASCLTIMEISA